MSDLSKRQKILKDRAKMLEKTRFFFSKKNILEVDCPALSKKPSIDTQIDVLSTFVFPTQKGFLHTSPEYCMKRLLAEGFGDIFQLSHVFRAEELGPLHQPEFTLIEWYRKNFSLEKLIEETLCLLKIFLPPLPHEIRTYRETFLLYTGLDIQKASNKDLLTLAKTFSHLPPDADNWDLDTLLQLILTHLIEPNLGKNSFYVLTDFPPSQAALARIECKEGFSVAKRFEIYFQGVELANGYHELADSKEQRERLLRANEEREAKGKEKLPLDEEFIKAVDHIGDCCGVSVGFDRLMMIRHQEKNLCEILPFSF